MRVLLVSNYLADGQRSMLRFSELLEAHLVSQGVEVGVTRPLLRCGRWVGATSKARKWLAYVDKFLIFPQSLKRESRNWDVTHLCDHSNSMYQSVVRSRTTVATCHDLLAVRGAMGESTFCPASSMGKRLQAAILRNLAVIPAVACDSEATLKDFVRLTGREAGSSLRKILLGFEGGFHPEREQKIRTGLAPFGLQPGAYLLHVGSSQRRKNREGILQVVERLGEKWSGQLVFAGEPLTGSQRQMARRLGVESRVVEINDVDDGLLRELYSGAHALLFPSFCEGFGWPILEAQACGCPVITADNTSLPEVAGEGALVFDADDIDGMAHAVLSLEDAETKASVVRCGFDNLKRFTVQRMATEYVTLYEEALATG